MSSQTVLLRTTLTRAIILYQPIFTVSTFPFLYFIFLFFSLKTIKKGKEKQGILEYNVMHLPFLWPVTWEFQCDTTTS